MFSFFLPSINILSCNKSLNPLPPNAIYERSQNVVSLFSESAKQICGWEESSDPETSVAIDGKRVSLDVDLTFQSQPGFDQIKKNRL